MSYNTERFINLALSIADDFNCSICMHIFEFPLELPCGHIYCSECLKIHFYTAITNNCFECRRPINFEEVKPANRKLLSAIANLSIKCEFMSSGCNVAVKLENLFAHTRACPFNLAWGSNGMPAEPIQQYVADMFHNLDDEQLQLLEAIADGEEQLDEEQEPSNNIVGDIDQSCGERVRCCTCSFSDVPTIIWACFLAANFLVQIAAITISAVNLRSCPRTPTLPRALMALGISSFLSLILDTMNCSCEDNFYACTGLTIIQSITFGSLVYASVVTYSNVGFNHQIEGKPTLVCDHLLDDFSFWYVTAIWIIIGTVVVMVLIIKIYQNLESIWSAWLRSYWLLSFIILIITFSLIMSISTVTMGSIYYNSCAAIPSLPRNVIVFGCFGSLCFLFPLLMKLDCDRDCDITILSFVVLAISGIVSLIYVAVDVHLHFPLVFSSNSLQFNTFDCDKTFYIFSFVVVCLNYFIVGVPILMYFIFNVFHLPRRQRFV